MRITDPIRSGKSGKGTPDETRVKLEENLPAEDGNT